MEAALLDTAIMKPIKINFRFSALGNDKSAKSSFEKKMQMKKQKNSIKDLANQIFSDKAAKAQVVIIL